MTLDLIPSCEIKLLIHRIVQISGKDYEEVEKILIKYSIYPTTHTPYLTTNFDGIVVGLKEDDQWLEDVLQEIFKENNLHELNISLPIHSIKNT